MRQIKLIEPAARTGEASLPDLRAQRWMGAEGRPLNLGDVAEVAVGERERLFHS